MKHILFVDDEPKILDGLKRSLRVMRHEWDMTFAIGGNAALKALDEAPFDVIVSDMRMPEMDGAQLLNQVKQRYPQIIRIVLSGHSDQAMIYQSIAATHQYLAKPCDIDLLKTTIMRAYALRELLEEGSLRRLVTGMQQIPSMPTLYAEIRREAESTTSSLTAIGEIISKDIGMTAKILQLVNSSYFGLRGAVSTPEQAVNLLGLDTVQALVLSVHIFSPFAAARGSCFDMRRLWETSTETGALARAIAKAEQVPAPVIDQAYTAGLLHNAGIVALMANVSDQYESILKTARDKNIPVWEVERQELGATHAEVGAYLLGLWGLSDPIVEAVAFHHRPTACAGERFCPLVAVHAANALHQELTQETIEGPSSPIDSAYLDKLHLTDRLPRWREIACEFGWSRKKECANE